MNTHTPPLRTLIFNTISNGEINRRVMPHHRVILRQLRRRHLVREEFHRQFLAEMRAAIGATEIQNKPCNGNNIVHLVAEGDLGICTICQEDITENQPFTRLRCSETVNHLFHKQCIIPWIKNHSSCPTCRADLST